MVVNPLSCSRRRRKRRRRRSGKRRRRRKRRHVFLSPSRTKSFVSQVFDEEENVLTPSSSSHKLNMLL